MNKMEISLNMITRLASYITIGCIAWATNPEGNYLLNIVLFAIIAAILEYRSYRDGIINGMYTYKNLKSEDKKKIDKAFQEMENE